MSEALRLNSMAFQSTRRVRPIDLQVMRQLVGCEDVAIIWADPSVALGFQACDVLGSIFCIKTELLCLSYSPNGPQSVNPACV